MYKTIYVPLDNSDYSNQAMRAGLELGRRFESRMVGCHVYAAKMHDYRFKQMEYTLPDEYLDETELERQRKIHDSLITMGLQLISDSYLEQMKKLCRENGLDFEPKMMDGKHHAEIVRDMEESDYDLTILGVMGIGRVRDSQIGSVCERVVRFAKKDVWVVKQLPDDRNGDQDTILVGVDGSPQSFGALVTAIELAAKFDKQVEAISVYDPYLHYSVFNGVVNVLTDKAAKVFRFEEQNQLHEEIIDTGLAQIYQSHLEVAEKLAADQDVEIHKTLLDGKAFQKVLDHVRKTNPWLLVIGRIGVHSPKDEPGLGSNAENLLRLCPCDVLLTTRLEYPELDIKAEESIRWTPEAEERMKRVPEMVRGIARTAIYRLAVEKGHSVISSDLLDEAMERYMPKSAAAQTRKLAEAIAIEKARTEPISICRKCGVTASESNPVKCAVCGGQSWQVITQEMLDKIAGMEGGLEEETTYDGRKLKWTQEAKRALWTMKDAYQRRRAKARVEKRARIRKMNVVTLEYARQVVEEETGVPLELPSHAPDEAPAETLSTGGNGDLKLVARDDKKTPLFSAFDWTGDAVQRVLGVPSGFMRDRTQARIEELASERELKSIDLALVEEGIAAGRKMMEEMIQTYKEDEQAAQAIRKGAGDDPVSATTDSVPTANQVADKDNGDGAGQVPESTSQADGNGTRGDAPAINEAGLHAALMSRKKPEDPEPIH